MSTLAQLLLPYDPNKLLNAGKQHDSEPTHPTHALWFSHHLCTAEASAYWTPVTIHLLLQRKSGLPAIISVFPKSKHHCKIVAC